MEVHVSQSYLNCVPMSTAGIYVLWPDTQSMDCRTNESAMTANTGVWSGMEGKR